MKSICLFLIFFFSLFRVSGQFNYIHGLSYRVDTFHFDQLYVLMQRYDLRDLNRVPERDVKERVLAANIGYLQGSLEQMNRYTIEKQDVFYNIRAAEGYIRDIKYADPTFDCTRYEEEMHFYMRISDKRYAVSEKIKQKEASEYAAFVQAQEAEQQRQKDEVKAMAAAQERHADSIEAIVANNEIKKQRREILKKYGPVNGRAINKGEVLLGMTPAMCRLAWGQPMITSKQTTTKGTKEKWVYTKFKYLVFTNGRVSAVNEGGVVDY